MDSCQVMSLASRASLGIGVIAVVVAMGGDSFSAIFWWIFAGGWGRAEMRVSEEAEAETSAEAMR